MKILGNMLLVVGAIIAVVTVIQVFSGGQLASVDSIEINNPDKISFYWSPITAVAFLVAGIAILIIRKKEKRKAVHKYYRYYQ
jgi:hypothetical protein